MRRFVPLLLAALCGCGIFPLDKCRTGACEGQVAVTCSRPADDAPRSPSRETCASDEVCQLDAKSDGWCVPAPVTACDVASRTRCEGPQMVSCLALLDGGSARAVGRCETLRDGGTCVATDAGAVFCD